MGIENLGMNSPGTELYLIPRLLNIARHQSNFFDHAWVNARVILKITFYIRIYPFAKFVSPISRIYESLDTTNVQFFMLHLYDIQKRHCLSF